MQSVLNQKPTGNSSATSGPLREILDTPQTPPACRPDQGPAMVLHREQIPRDAAFQETQSEN